MTEEDRLFQQTGRAEDFAFDERVAKIFDNMASRFEPLLDAIKQD
jgi:tRNA (cmo5U34)-methyltransferase